MIDSADLNEAMNRFQYALARVILILAALALLAFWFIPESHHEVSPTDTKTTPVDGQQMPGDDPRTPGAR